MFRCWKVPTDLCCRPWGTQRTLLSSTCFHKWASKSLAILLDFTLIPGTHFASGRNVCFRAAGGSVNQEERLLPATSPGWCWNEDPETHGPEPREATARSSSGGGAESPTPRPLSWNPESLLPALFVMKGHITIFINHSPF